MAFSLASATPPRVAQERIEEAFANGRTGLSVERARLMDLICSVNPSASRDFLDRFSDRALRHYQDHLEAAAKPRGRGASWVRTGESPAVIGRESN
jgi:hypothetical protein